MPNIKEIRTKIHSIQSTQKITRAMEMVAASKMRKSQQRMQASRPYLQRVKEVVNHLIHGQLEYKHSYLALRPEKTAIFIIISSERGLCGGLNINLFKEAIQKMRELEKNGVVVKVCTIGKRAESFFVHYKANVFASKKNIGDAPKMQDLIGIMKVALDAFDAGETDSVYLCYNKFISTLVQQPQVALLLPIMDTQNSKHGNWDYIYEPDAVSLLDVLLHRYIETLIYNGAVENVACEQAARMVAMKNASDNADELIENLKLVYNKARQAAITKELAEIVAGAAAV